MANDELQNPFIVQCKKCNLIVADSFSLVDYKNNHLAFTSVSTSTKLNRKRMVSQDSFDKDCTYSEVLCDCKTIIGRKYYTVNAICANLVERYCINDNLVKTYMLGTTIDASVPNLTEVCEEIHKLKRFCEYLYRKTNS